MLLDLKVFTETFLLLTYLLLVFFPSLSFLPLQNLTQSRKQVEGKSQGTLILFITYSSKLLPSLL
jgi:hypothetical protein